MNKWDLNFKILGYHKTNHIIYQIHVICNKKSELAFCEGFEEILHYGMMRCCSLCVCVCSLGIYFWEHLELRNLANVSLGTFVIDFQKS